MKNKNIKVLTIGGATLDTIIKYQRMETMQIERPCATESYLLLEEGAKIEVTEQKYFSGGGATNAAASFKKQLYDVSFFGKIGKDSAGELIINELENLNVDISNVLYSEDHGTASSFVVPSLKGDRTVFAYRGANVNLLTQDLPAEAIKRSDFVYVTSLSNHSAARLPEIVNIAKENQVKVAINPGISQLLVGSGFIKNSLFGIDIFILNYDEAKQLMASFIKSNESIPDVVESGHLSGEVLLDSTVEYQDMRFSLRQYFKHMLSLGPRIVVVTNGGDGVYVATNEKLYFHNSQKIENVVNTLGAGDAFGSGFVGAIYSGKSIIESIRHGIVNSASVIAYPDAKKGLLDWEDIEEKTKQIPESEVAILPW